MTIELQLRTGALVTLTRQTLRQSLRTACIPPGPGLSIDHVEVSGADFPVQQVGSAVEMRVPTDVFVVTDAQLLAAPNATPQGATVPAGGVVFPVRLEVQTADEPAPGGSGTRRRTWLRLVARKPLIDGLPDPLRPVVDPLLQALVDTMPTPRVEITDLLEILLAGDLAQVSVVVGDGVVAVRFGGAGAVTSHLPAGLSWGVYASGDAITRMIRGLIEPHLRGALSIISVDAQYHHDGATPRVSLTAGVMIGIFGARLGAEIQLSATLQLLPGPSPVLRTAVTWSIDIETALLIPIVGPVAALAMAPVAEAIATGIVSDALDVTSFGATPTGTTSFVLDRPLPPLQLGLGTLRYDALSADDAGIVLGGALLVGAVANTPFDFSVSPFGGPSRIQLCSLLAKSGSGNPSHESPSLANTQVQASAEFHGVGRFCRVELRSPGGEWLPCGRRPAHGSAADVGTIDVRLNYGVALGMPGPMRLVVRTPRGVRFVDFGHAPPPQFDQAGRLKLVIDAYIPDCNMMVARERGRWGIGWRWRREDFKPVPLELPEWALYVRDGGGVIVQLATLSGLEPGEFIRFRSATHSIHATADAAGRLEMPVVQPMQVAAAAPAFLERVDGRTLQGHVAIETAAFAPLARLPGTLARPAVALPSGGLALTTRAGEAVSRHTVSAHGMLQSAALNPQPLLPVDEGALSALNPQPLPPVDDGAWPAERVARLGLQGVKRVTWVPGFHGRCVALADVGPDGHLLLDLRGARTRVAGTFVGPIGPLSTARHLALMDTGEQVVVFQRLETPAPLPATLHVPAPTGQAGC